MRGGIDARNRQRCRGNVNRDPGGPRQSRQQRDDNRAGAAADVGNGQGVVMAAFGADDFENQIDQRFGVGARIENAGRHFKYPAVEFALSQYP